MSQFPQWLITNGPDRSYLMTCNAGGSPTSQALGSKLNFGADITCFCNEPQENCNSVMSSCPEFAHFPDVTITGTNDAGPSHGPWSWTVNITGIKKMLNSSYINSSINGWDRFTWAADNEIVGYFEMISSEPGLDTNGVIPCFYDQGQAMQNGYSVSQGEAAVLGGGLRCIHGPPDAAGFWRARLGCQTANTAGQGGNPFALPVVCPEWIQPTPPAGLQCTSGSGFLMPQDFERTCTFDQNVINDANTLGTITFS